MLAKPPSLICEIAHGGMGTVTLCMRREGSFRRLYAVKHLHRHLRTDPGVREMFLEEARLSGLVRHPNVTSVFDVGEDDEGPFLVMDFVDGVSVSTILSQTAARGEQLPLQLCVSICLDAARGLHAAHELPDAAGKPLGLVHRDVSPQNILVGFDGIVRVTDFGIAKAVGNAHKTSVGVLKGSAGYMSPEHLRFQDLDRRSDLFSLGVVLYELLAGVPLYAGSVGPEAARRILGEPEPDIGDVRDDVPPELSELLFRMLAKNPEDRLSSAMAVGTALEAVLLGLLREEVRLDVAAFVGRHFGDLRLTSRPEVVAALASDPTGSVGPRKGVRRWAVVAAVAAVAVAAVSLLLFLPRTGPRSPAPKPSEATNSVLGAKRGIWAGAWHTCTNRDGTLRCWGKNNEGQLGTGSSIDAQTPTEVMGPLRGVVDVDGGSFHTCALLANGEILCFGSNAEGQLGTGNFDSQRVPTRVIAKRSFSDLDAGDHHTCAISNDRRLYCWGDNRTGQLGDGTTTMRREPTLVRDLDQVLAVSAGGKTTCVLSKNGTYCWGDLNFDTYARLPNQTVPKRLVGLDDVVEIGVGGPLACARRANGHVACWGRNENGQLGDGTRVDRVEPRDVPELDQVIEMAVGPFHVCVLRIGFQVMCWGRNAWGNLGVGTFEDSLRPLQVQQMLDAQTLTAGSVHTCARMRLVGMLCWGHNDSGQLGDGTVGRNRSRPVSVAGID